MIDETRKNDLAEFGAAMLPIILGLRLFADMVRTRGITSDVKPNPWQDNYRRSMEQLRGFAANTGKIRLPVYAAHLEERRKLLVDGLEKLGNLFGAAATSEARALERVIAAECDAVEAEAQELSVGIGKLIDNNPPVAYGGAHLAILYIDRYASKTP